ncbi:MAG: hypothetical protein WC915_03210 [archaeon]|jgi:predicted transcriptional regulator
MEPLTIVVGRDMDKDQADLLSGKNVNLPKFAYYVDTYEEVSKLLSPKNLELLKLIVSFSEWRSIGEIAKASNRKQEAISRDIKKLKANGFIKTKRDGKRTLVEPKYSKIIIEI